MGNISSNFKGYGDHIEEAYSNLFDAMGQHRNVTDVSDKIIVPGFSYVFLAGTDYYGGKHRIVSGGKYNETHCIEIEGKPLAPEIIAVCLKTEQ